MLVLSCSFIVFSVWNHDNELEKSDFRVSTILPRPNSPMTFPVSQPTFSDLYCHKFQYQKHTIIYNTNTNYLGVRILPSDKILYRVILSFFSCRYFTCCLKLGKISIIRSITGTFSTGQCAILYFSMIFQVSLHSPQLSLTNQIPWPYQFPWCVGTFWLTRNASNRCWAVSPACGA